MNGVGVGSIHARRYPSASAASQQTLRGEREREIPVSRATRTTRTTRAARESNKSSPEIGMDSFNLPLSSSPHASWLSQLGSKLLGKTASHNNNIANARSSGNNNNGINSNSNNSGNSGSSSGTPSTHLLGYAVCVLIVVITSLSLLTTTGLSWRKVLHGDSSDASDGTNSFDSLDASQRHLSGSWSSTEGDGDKGNVKRSTLHGSMNLLGDSDSASLMHRSVNIAQLDLGLSENYPVYELNELDNSMLQEVSVEFSPDQQDRDSQDNGRRHRGESGESGQSDRGTRKALSGDGDNDFRNHKDSRIQDASYPGSSSTLRGKEHSRLDEAATAAESDGDDEKNAHDSSSSAASATSADSTNSVQAQTQTQTQTQTQAKSQSLNHKQQNQEDQLASDPIENSIEDTSLPFAGEDIFVDQEAYNNAPLIDVLPESPKLKYRAIVLEHERYFRKHPSRLYVPRLRKDVKLSRAEFVQRFAQVSQPVVVPYDAMRHLGFEMRSYTLDELLQIYPNHGKKIYTYGAKLKGELDLGPAIASLASNETLKKTAKGRNFPRNTKVSVESVSKLGVEPPPYVLPDTKFMAPSVWFGTSTSSTKFHSDCCDNFAMMVTGTKLWTVSPPSEARILKPKCTGGLCWVKSLEHPDEHAESPSAIALRDKLQKTSFELRPNEMLFLPCGWFHHVENMDPTIMVNWWTKTRPMFLDFQKGNVKKLEDDKSAQTT